MNNLEPILVHNHTSRSNFRLKDATNEVETLLDYALSIGLPGLAITDHETVSAHIRAIKHVEKNKEKFKDFKLILGNEIYLCDKEKTLHAFENNEKTEFPHFILLAKDKKGHEALRKLSSMAWSNSKWFRGLERVPTYKDELAEVMKEYKGHLIATTACLGGEINKYTAELEEIQNDPTQQDRANELRTSINNFVQYMIDAFGKEDVYFEIQPSKNDRQNIANKWLVHLSDRFDIPYIVTTDAHYLNKAQALAHKIYLESAGGEREVEEFYSTTYLMNRAELSEFIREDWLDTAIKNTHSLAEKVEMYSLSQKITVPLAKIPEFTPTKDFEPYYEKYEYIKDLCLSESLTDKYFMYSLAEGMKKKNLEWTEERLSRINTECMEIYLISQALEQPMSSYFVLTADIIQIMWLFSLVGPSRGSAACFFVNYLLEITQFSPLDYHGMPHWRFMSASKVELPDIDIDTESAQRKNIIEAVKEKYGRENVLNMGTITTEGAKSAIISACRGVGLDRDLAESIATLIPYEKKDWPLKDLLLGNEEEGRKPQEAFVREVKSYPGLMDTMITIAGIASGCSQHASGVVIFPNGYVSQNAMMKTTSGLEITQFDAKDTESAGGLKLDFLSITSLDRIRAAIALLIKDGAIEWKGSLKETYDAYFHPDRLEMVAPEMYDLLFDGHVFNAFQFETALGQQIIKKLNARSFEQLAAGNNLMRLSSSGEQPIDKFIKHKNNPELWDKEMMTNGLTFEDEQPLRELLSATYGICDSQELIMMLFMHPQIANSTLAQANKFRKAVAKQDKEELAEQKKLFYSLCDDNGTSAALRDYVWKFCFEPTFGYAFSAPHTNGYTLVLFIQMNICFRYGAIYWKTACMSVNSGLVGENIDGGTDYGKVAQASNELKDSISYPDVNLSEIGFKPLVKENKILFGFKPIAGLSTSAALEIIENRPYSSFQDFYEKMVDKIPVSQIVVSIKAGLFNRFNPNRRAVMMEFVTTHIKKREKLTLTQFPKLIPELRKQGLLLDEITHYEWRTRLQGRKKITFNKEIEEQFLTKYERKVKYSYDEDGKLVVDLKSFGDYFEANFAKARQFLTTPEALDMFSRIEKNEFWLNNCSGSPLQWEMETTLTQLEDHEINHMPLSQYVHLSKYLDLPVDPEIERFRTLRGGRRVPVYKNHVIAGTVVDKSKKGHVYLLTPEGLVTVRYSKGQWLHYDKKEVTQRENSEGKKEKVTLDESWFKRGTRLVISGFRQGDEFVVRKGPQFEHTTLKIVSYTKDQVKFQSEKIRA